MDSFKKVISVAILGTIVWYGNVFAINCSFTCPGGGTTVVIDHSCTLTKSIDCRDNNIKINDNVVVEVNKGVLFSLDLKNHKLDIGKGARLELNKDAVISQHNPPPKLKIENSNLNKTTKLTDINIPGTRGNDSSWYNSNIFTVPDGVEKINVSFKINYQEEPGYDYLTVYIYKNGGGYKSYGNYDWRGTVSINETINVNKGDRIQIKAYQHHDQSINWGDSSVTDIEITYTLKGDRKIKLEGNVNDSDNLIIEVSTDGGRHYNKSYTLNNNEKRNKAVKINDIKNKLGISFNNNTYLRTKLKLNGNWFYGSPVKANTTLSTTPPAGTSTKVYLTWCDTCNNGRGNGNNWANNSNILELVKRKRGCNSVTFSKKLQPICDNNYGGSLVYAVNSNGRDCIISYGGYCISTDNTNNLCVNNARDQVREYNCYK